MEKLLQLLRTKGKDGKLIIPFKSKFFGDGKEWVYSGKEATRKLLWMEELKFYLLSEFDFYVMPEPYDGEEDDSTHWKCDVISSYFTEPEDDDITYDTYEKALLDGLIFVCDILISNQ